MEREIMRFLMRSTGDREDAMDLFQETWLRAYRAYPDAAIGRRTAAVDFSNRIEPLPQSRAGQDAPRARDRERDCGRRSAGR